MPDARVQLTVEIETQGAEQLTALRRELDSLGPSARAAFRPLDASLTALVNRLRDSRQLVGSLESVFSNFFRRLLGETRNFRDAFKRLLLDLLQFFLRIVARMIAAWTSALRSFASFAPGGFGGFTFPGFSTSPTTPPTFPTGGGSLTLGGVIGSVVGAVAGLFGGGSSRPQGPNAADILLDAQRTMLEVFNAYRNHRLTAPAAVAQINSLLQQAAQALAPLGSRGRGALDVLTQMAAAHTGNIRRIERRRRRRAAIITSLPIPEFQFGGLVSRSFGTLNAVDGRVLAFLHPGEAVLNRRAVRALGAHRIQAINQAAGGAGVPARHRGAPSFQGGGLVGQPILPGQAPTINLGPIIIQNADDPQATAEAVIREIRRRARDRGLPSPV